MNKHKSFSFIAQSISSLWKTNVTDESGLFRAALLQKKIKTIKLIFNRMDKSKIFWDQTILGLMLDLNLNDEILDLHPYLTIESMEHLVNYVKELEPIIKNRVIELTIEKDDPFLLVKIVKGNIFEMDEFLTENSIIFQKAVQKDAKKVITFLYNLGLIVPDCMFYKQRKLQKNIYNFLNELTCNDIKYLQKKYKKIFYLQDSYQNTLLHYAVLDNNIEFVDCLLSNNFENVNQKNLWFLTPLHEAVRMEFHDMANLLRNYGAFLQTFRDSDQSVIGKRQEYFQKLEYIMKFIPLVFDEKFLVQLFHSQASNSHLYCCSLHHSTNSLKDFHEAISKLVFERFYFIFEKQLMCLENCDQKSQKDFFLSPLCKDHNVKFLYSWPFIHGQTFLGYFLIWSKQSLNIERLEKFAEFMYHFMKSEFCHCISVYPDQTNYFLSLEMCQDYISKHKKNIVCSLSFIFIPAIRFFLPVVKNNRFEFLEPIFKTLLDCHVPVCSLSSDIYKILLPFSALNGTRSFLYDQMKLTIPLPDIHSLNFKKYWKMNNPVLLKTIDIYEITGNHTGISYNKKLCFFNDLIVDPFSWNHDPKTLWELVSVELLGKFEFRKQAVLGMINKTSYRIFLPFYEIEIAIQELFAFKGDILVQLFIYYNWLLEWIHPFEDGNGRSVRFFMTIYMRAHGIPIIFDSDCKVLSSTEFYKKTSHAIRWIEEDLLSPPIKLYSSKSI
jgi:hypothetical protein